MLFGVSARPIPLHLGAKYTFAKPFDISDLIDAVNELLEGKAVS